jgi:hypothetical protein
VKHAIPFSQTPSPQTVLVSPGQLLGYAQDRQAADEQTIGFCYSRENGYAWHSFPNKIAGLVVILVLTYLFVFVLQLQWDCFYRFSFAAGAEPVIFVPINCVSTRIASGTGD